MQTQTGTVQWNNAVSSNTNIQFEISSQTIVNGNNYRSGRMIPGETSINANGNVELANAKIVIYEGTINQFMSDTQDSQATIPQAYQMNTTTNDERIAAVAGHEIVHTSQDNMNQNFENKYKGASHNLEATRSTYQSSTFKQIIMKKIIFIFFILTPVLSYAQSDSLRVFLYDFLISTDDLSEYSKSRNTLLIINDLVSLKDLTNQDYGIFKFGTLTSHSYFHLLLKEKSEYITVDMHQPLEITMQIVLKYMKDKSIFTKNDVITHLNAIILLHQTNTDAISWKTE